MIPTSIPVGIANMVLEGNTKFIKQGRDKMVLYIPVDIIRDSRFPFKGEEDLFISVDPETQSIVVTLRDNVPSYRDELRNR